MGIDTEVDPGGEGWYPVRDRIDSPRGRIALQATLVDIDPPDE